MKVGDLVKMERGYSALGLVVEIVPRMSLRRVKIIWMDDSDYSIEREKDLVVINESR
tara:strand:- start:3784 stop:3954 length:171 start_codon:yes stop_codon:yes gene_type:complete